VGAFGTGVGSLLLEDAARLVVGAVRKHAPGSLERVVFASVATRPSGVFRAAVDA
jgi:O-acetyl-ADP-ribose deacetylase (regulator of RNase III)